jgi:Domain of unknown function (DUF4381)
MEDALKQLHDLHLPPAPGFWPPAPGWWLLAVLVIGVVTWLVLHWYRLQRRRRPLRLAVMALDRLLVDVREHHLPAREFADAVNALLKRALIHGAHRIDAAPLTGNAWLVYLDAFTVGNVFSRGAGAALGNERFAPEFHNDPAGVHAAARQVLRTLYTQRRVPR